MTHEFNSTGIAAFDALCRRDCVESAAPFSGYDTSGSRRQLVCLTDGWTRDGGDHLVVDSAAQAEREIDEVFYSPEAAQKIAERDVRMRLMREAAAQEDRVAALQNATPAGDVVDPDKPPRYCVSCGERVRLRWPRDEPRYCSMRCPADSFREYAETGPWEASFCGWCGDSECKCGG